MDRLRTFLGGALTAIAAAGLASPAVGADTEGTLAIVNGIPGKRIDVCVNGKEIKSNLPYGGAVLRDVVGVGEKNLKFTEPDTRTCRGRQVAQDTFYLDNGNDVTIVLTKNAPKIIYFYNNAPEFLGEIPPLGSGYGGNFTAFRHAAEFAVNLRVRSWSPSPEGPMMPAAAPLWFKGDGNTGSTLPDFIVRVRATLPEDLSAFAEKRVEMTVNRRYEWILVGTKPGNSRFVLLDRRISLSSP